MKRKKIMSVFISAALTSALMTSAASVTAEDGKTDSNWSYNLINMHMKNKTDDGVHTQWYTTDDDGFRAEGLTVSYDGTDVSRDCVVQFPKGVTPANTYDGLTHEYIFPVDVTYKDMTMEASIITMIGEPGDSNEDRKVDARDAALIARDVESHTPTKRSKVTPFGRFLTTGNRNEKVYDLTAAHAADIAKKLAKSSITNAERGKKLEQKTKSVYSLSLSKAVGIPGQEVIVQVLVGTGDNFESLDCVIEWEGDGYVDLDPAFSAGGTKLASVADGDIVSIVDYGNKTVKDGAIANLRLKIPEDAVPGKEYGLAFNEVKTFSVFNKSGSSKNVADKVNINNTTVLVKEPSTTTAKVTTATSKTTTTKTTSTKTTKTTTTKAKKPVVIPPSIKAVIETPPEKTEFDMGEFTDLEGMKLSLYYAEGDDNYTNYSARSEYDYKYKALYKNTTLSEHPDLFSRTIEVTELNQYMLVISPSDQAVKEVIEDHLKNADPDKISIKNADLEIKIHPYGDANYDFELSVRDASCIAKALAAETESELPKISDYNQDGVINVRDAAGIAACLSQTP